MPKSYKKIAAVMKIKPIIEFLSNQREPVKAPEISEGTGMPVGTLMCYLVTLEEAGFVRQIGEAYELGMLLSRIWARKKALLEGEHDRIHNDLKLLGVEHEEAR